MIPTPSPSRMLQQWRADNSLVAGTRYEELDKGLIKSLSPPGPVLKKGRRISKDMVSHPMGFVYVLLVLISVPEFLHDL